MLRRSFRKPKSNFHVEFEDLGALVELATSDEHGEHELGRQVLTDPVFEVTTVLTTNADVSGGDGYILESRITALPNRKLQVDEKSYPSFRTGTVTSLHLTSPKTPEGSGILVDVGRYNNSGGVELWQSVHYGGHLTETDVERALEGFAKALEESVNGVYANAGKDSPDLVHVLKTAEAIKPIANRHAGTVRRSATTKDKADPQHEVSLEATASTVTFDNIGGYQNVKDELTMFILGIKNPEAAVRHGYHPPKGILLEGPPGTGKTLFGKAIAGESGAEFFYIDSTSVLNMYVGNSPAALRDVFDKAAKAAEKADKPVIIFMDEIDAIFPTRDGSHQVNRELVSVFNQYMDGFLSEKVKNVYVVAATNKPELMDPSVIRPPRFIRIPVPLPNLDERESILRVNAAILERDAASPLFDPSIDYHSLAGISDGYSGAELASALTDVRKDAFRMSMDDEMSELPLTTYDQLRTKITKSKSTDVRRPLGFTKDP